MWAAARALGMDGEHEATVRGMGYASALARFFQAVPSLEARGRVPLVDGRAGAVRSLAEEALKSMPSVRDFSRPLVGRAALMEAWLARALLKRVVKAPSIVAEGALETSEFRKRLGLWLVASF